MAKIIELNKVTTNSPQETIDVGRKIAGYLKSGDIVYLFGELGSGKTVLVKGICGGLGVKDSVTSSSFVIATEYVGRVPVSHIDLYRLNRGDATELPIDEYYFHDGVTIIEWADRIDSKRKNGIDIKITILGKGTRELNIEDLRD